MTYEEANKILKKDIGLCRFNPISGEDVPMNQDAELSAQAMETAIVALEKQIPRAPIIEMYTNRVPSEQEVYVCPVCGEYFGDCHDLFYKQKYCPECGQRLDWEDCCGTAKKSYKKKGK